MGKQKHFNIVGQVFGHELSSEIKGQMTSELNFVLEYPYTLTIPVSCGFIQILLLVKIPFPKWLLATNCINPNKFGIVHVGFGFGV